MLGRRMLDELLEHSSTWRGLPRRTCGDCRLLTDPDGLERVAAVRAGKGGSLIRM
jgi:hypothetical protein